MMRRATLLLAAALACGALAASNQVVMGRLSGNDFVAQISGQPGVDKWHQSPRATYAQHFAEGYQAGVVDSTEGRLWCAPAGMAPDEVDDRIWAELRKREGTMPGRAADQMVSLYAARFPCPGGR